MSWLAQVLIPKKDAIARNLKDNNEWHKFSWKCCTTNREGQKRDFLTRLDIGNQKFRLYILARRKPERPDNCLEDWWQCIEVRQDFLEHETYRFSLRANPVKKVKVFDEAGHRRKNNRKLAILDIEEQRAWLERKARQGGFMLDSRVPLVVSPTQLHVFKHENRNTSNIVTQISVDYSGLLRVTDKSLFRQTFLMGIGSSRAFGFGMLVLQPFDI